MAFVLEDIGKEDHEFAVNSWHWQAILQLLAQLELVSDDDLEWMSFNGTPCILPAERAQRIGRELRQKVLAQLQPGERIDGNGNITTETDDGTFYRNWQDLAKNYGTNQQVLTAFCEFCRTCSGFRVL